VIITGGNISSFLHERQPTPCVPWGYRHGGGGDISGFGAIVKIKVGHILILEVDTTEWNIEHMSGRFMLYSLVLLGGIGEGITVWNRLDT